MHLLFLLCFTAAVIAPVVSFVNLAWNAYRDQTAELISKREGEIRRYCRGEIVFTGKFGNSHQCRAAVRSRNDCHGGKHSLVINSGKYRGVHCWCCKKKAVPKVPKVPTGDCVQKDFDIWLKDYTTKIVDKYEECALACKDTSSCEVWKYNKRNCYMGKFNVNKGITKWSKGIYTGYKACSCAPGLNKVNGICVPGTWIIKNANGFVLEVPGGDNAKWNSVLKVWSKHGGKNQQWRLDNNWLINGLHSHWVADIEGGHRHDGALVYIYDKKDAINQKWEFKKEGDWWYIHSKMHGKVLTAQGSGKGSRVVMTTKDGSKNQKWKIYQV